MRRLWQDVTFGVRTLAKSPGFTAVAVLTLALGIGATTVIFSLVKSILLEPTTFRDADRIVFFYVHDPSHPAEFGRGVFSGPEFKELREQNHVFEDVMGMGCQDIIYSRSAGNEGAQQFMGCQVTGNTFAFLGVKPLLGRWITEADAQPGAPPVCALDYRRWKSEFNGDPKILGSTFVLNGRPYTLVGIMPPRYTLGDGDVWIPVDLSHGDLFNIANGIPVSLVARGRLKPGVNEQVAAADLGVVAAQLAKVYPKNYPAQFTMLVKKLNDALVGDFRGTMYALVASVAMLLLIACSNVANMLLVRATVREKEMALRAALGATPSRLVEQLLVESLILSAIACLLGCAFAYVALRAVVALVPVGAGVPTNVAFGLDAQALWFAVAIAIVATFLCGLAPAIHSVRGDLIGRLSGSGKGAGGGYRHGKLRSGLVVVEVALSVLLLTGTGLMVRTLFALERVDLGFNPKNMLFTILVVPRGPYDSAEGKKNLIEQILARTAELPGVVSVAETVSIPPFGGLRSDMTIPGKSQTERAETDFELCSEGLFRTLGVPVLRGRAISDADVESARRVVVINETLARKYFANEDPIGQTIKFNLLDNVPDAPHDAYFEIIGVVSDFRNDGLREPSQPSAFTPYTITGAWFRSLIVRTSGDPLSMLETVRRGVWGVDSNVALGQSWSIEGFLKQYLYSGPEFGLAVFGAFGGIGLALVVIGVFSVMAYNVSLQTHELGIRMALGAQRAAILRMVLGRGAILVGLGAAIGVASAYSLARLMASLIWGVSATDPATFGAVVAVIAVVGLAACALPARLAARVDPNVALRYE